LIAVVLEDRDARLRVVDLAEPDRHLHEWIRSYDYRPVDSSLEDGWRPDYTVQQVVVDLALGDNFREPFSSDETVELVAALLALSQVILRGREAQESLVVATGPSPVADVLGTVFRYSITERPHSVFEVSELEIGVTDEARYSENRPDLRLDRLRSISWDLAGSFEDAEDLCQALFERHHSWGVIRAHGGHLDWDPHWKQAAEGVWVWIEHQWT
jgi:hypothetical protein